MLHVHAPGRACLLVHTYEYSARLSSQNARAFSRLLQMFAAGARIQVPDYRVQNQHKISVWLQTVSVGKGAGLKSAG